MFCLYMSEVENCISYMKILNLEYKHFQVKKSNALLDSFASLPFLPHSFRLFPFSFSLPHFHEFFRIFSHLVIFISLQVEDFPKHWMEWIDPNGLAWYFENMYINWNSKTILIPKGVNLENIRLQFCQLLFFYNNSFVWKKSICQEGGIEMVDTLCLCLNPGWCFGDFVNFVQLTLTLKFQKT